MNDDPHALVQGIVIISDGAIETALGRLEIPGGYVAGSEDALPDEPAAS